MTDLEVKVAYQDDLLDALNRLVATQQDHIARLQGDMRHLYEQMKTLQPSGMGDSDVEPPPPHY
ncbi:SlyX family protein [Paraperlucidibaca wandonensis]|uniref:SlyX family protein n=1 Tax=Paraperlucidibaca wandonensis TaxID=1268273 RepID=A0ABW3HGA5_9GAMM